MTIEPLNSGEAIKRLLTLRSEQGYPRDPRALLELATLPSLVLRRPRSTRQLTAAVAQVEQTVLEPARERGLRHAQGSLG
jgi:hypothetical protein